MRAGKAEDGMPTRASHRKVWQKGENNERADDKPLVRQRRDNQEQGENIKTED